MTSIEWLVAKIEKHDKEFSSFYGAEITEAIDIILDNHLHQQFKEAKNERGIK